MKKYLEFLEVFLVILLANFVASSKTVDLNPDTIKSFYKEFDMTLVLWYEEWCGHSEKALKIFDDF